jgi:hypothetical protein
MQGPIPRSLRGASGICRQPEKKLCLHSHHLHAQASPPLRPPDSSGEGGEDSDADASRRRSHLLPRRRRGAPTHLGRVRRHEVQLQRRSTAQPSTHFDGVRSTVAEGSRFR